MPASIGVNLRVTGNCRQGGRKYMEDFFSVAYQQTEDEKDLEYAFFGIYDGHGGAEAAAFAKEHLMETIIKHKNFWSDNDEDVLRAIKDGYIATHYAMWREQCKWPRTSSGLPSTAGTTASVAFIRRGKIYIGHVGDSGIVLGYQEPGSPEWRAKPLTKDHKPESPEEMKRIESCGGKVVSKSGVPRVVWNRPKIGHQGPVRRSTPIDEIPFLAVARSLGDLWSYNSQINQFVVSPDPDCSVLPIDTNVHRCLVFGTDGLFNMLSPGMAVHLVQWAEEHNESAALSDATICNKVWLNPSKLLVEKALDRWHATKMRADNTSVVTLMLDPPGPPRAQVLKDRKKNLPESGLKIMTRYDGNTSQESCSSESNCSRSLQMTDISEAPSSDDTAQPNVPLSTPEVVPLGKSHDKEKSDEKTKSVEKMCPESKTSNTSISSSDVSSNYPLKERNYAPKLRESTSFDPREPYKASDVDKENSTDKIEDNTIQINEISSSNIEETGLDEEPDISETIENEKPSKCVLRSSLKKGKNGENEEKKPLKRKLEVEESTHHQRKSMRLSLTQKFLDGGREPAPCTLAEEKLKKLAEEAEKLKLAEEQAAKAKTENEKSSNSSKDSVAVKKLSITQKILKSKKVNLKKKSILRAQLNKKKLKKILESVVAKTTRSKSLPPRGNKDNIAVEEKKEKILKNRESNEKSPLREKVLVVNIEENVGKTGRSVAKDEKLEKKDKKMETGLVKVGKAVERPKKDKKVVLSGKLSNFKRQSARNASLRSKDKIVATKVKGKPLKNVIVKSANQKPAAKPTKQNVTLKNTKPVRKEVLAEIKSKNDCGSSKKSKVDAESVPRGTRASLNSSGALRSSSRISDANKKLEAKENVKGPVPRGAKSSSSKAKQPPAAQAQKKVTLRQRIQDKTKTLRKTVLRKSR